MAISVTHPTPSGGEVNEDDYLAEHTVTGVASDTHTHSGSDITSGTVADARIASTLTRDSEAAAAYSAIGHDHDGSPEAQLAQANTHQSPDTDSGTSSLHHTIGTGANQAAAGNHNHVLSALTAPAADVSMNSHKITNVTDPGSNQDAATKKYVDDSVAAGVSFGSTAAAIGTSSGGAASSASRSDHVHATGAGTPSTQAFGDAAATGTGPAAAMTDHKHAMPTVIRGRVTAAGGVGVGSGFTVNKTATGKYTISFSVAFGTEPIVVCTVWDTGGATTMICNLDAANPPTVNDFHLFTLSGGGSTFANADFEFIAIAS